MPQPRKKIGSADQKKIDADEETSDPRSSLEVPPRPLNEWDLLSPRERLSLALDVINRADLSVEMKLHLEQSLLEGYDRDSEASSTSSTSPPTSDSSSPESSSNNGDYWTPSPEMKLRQEDWPEFVVETTNRFLMVLESEVEMLESLAKEMPPKGSHILPIETQAALLEVARVTAVKMNLAALAASESTLLVPDKTLLGPDGNPLKGRPNA